MDSSCWRSRRSRNSVTSRRRGVSPSTTTSDSDADTDDDPDSRLGRFRRRSNPANRTQYRTRERSRSPVYPAPTGSFSTGPSLPRVPCPDAIFATSRVSWAPVQRESRDPIGAETSATLRTNSSASDVSDSFTPASIRITRAISSADDEDPEDEYDYTQVIESLSYPNRLSLFSSEEEDEDYDEDLELSEVYGVDHDNSEPGEDGDWSPTPCETEAPVPVPTQPIDPTVPQDQGPLAGTLMELLECPVCFEPMQPPIWQCSRGHLVCRDCAPKLRRCPTCRCSAQRTRNCTLEKVSSALNYPCCNQHRGCTVRLPPAQLRQHQELLCVYRDASCRVQSCSWVGAPTAAAAHARDAHAGLTRILQLGRPVLLGISVPTSSGQRVTRVLRLVNPERVFFLHLQLNSSSNAAQWCSYIQEFGQESESSDIEYRLDLDENSAAEKRLVRPHVVNEVVAMMIRRCGRKIDARQDEELSIGAWRDATYRAKVYSATETPDDAPGSSRTRCFSFSQLKRALYSSNTGSIKARIVVNLWATPAVRPHNAGDVPTSTATS